MTTSKDGKTAAAYTRASVEAYLEAAGAERQRILLAIADARSRIDLARRRQARLDALVAGVTDPAEHGPSATGSPPERAVAPPVPVPVPVPVPALLVDHPAGESATNGSGQDEVLPVDAPLDETQLDETPWPGIPVASRAGSDRERRDRQASGRPVRREAHREVERTGRHARRAPESDLEPDAVSGGLRASVDEDGLLRLERTAAGAAVPRD